MNESQGFLTVAPNPVAGHKLSMFELEALGRDSLADLWRALPTDDGGPVAVAAFNSSI